MGFGNGVLNAVYINQSRITFSHVAAQDACRVPSSWNFDMANHSSSATQTPSDMLRALVRASLAVVDANRNQLNALNVFPVPDGDTGTNMMLTLRNIEEHLDKQPASDFSATVENMAKAALLGARGNSGLILQSVFQGMRVGLKGESELNGGNFAASLAAAKLLAYQAVPQPREGTMLTVIRESADAAAEAIERDGDDAALVDVVKCVAEEAMRSVERTPELLDVLKQAGVIDSGGWGLAIMFESMHRYLKGEGEVTILLDPPKSSAIAGTGASIAVDTSFIDTVEEEEWGYCTVFAVEGVGIDLAAIQSEMEQIGRSPVIAGGDTLVKVHLHTEDPGLALSAGIKHGALSNIDINNMDVQAAEWVGDRRSGVNGSDTSAPAMIDIGVLAVVSGGGMSAYFNGVAPGAVSIVEGGDSLNPSVEELLNGIESVPSEQVIVLPNNKNILGAAEQAAGLSEKSVSVIPTNSMQAGIAAIGAFDPDMEMEDNVEEMSEMLIDLHVGFVFKSVRDAVVNDVEVKLGQYLVTVDGDALAASDDEVDLLVDGVMSSMHHGASVFVFVGGDEDPRRASEAHSRIREETSQYHRVEVNFIDGGQPSYNYLFSIE